MAETSAGTTRTSVGRFVILEFLGSGCLGRRYFVTVARPDHKNLAVGAKHTKELIADSAFAAGCRVTCGVTWPRASGTSGILRPLCRV